MDHIRNSESDELTLKEIILKVQEYLIHLWRFKYIFLLFIPVLGVSGLFFAKGKVPFYTSKMTFMVNEDQNNSSSGVGAILGQFGLGGGSNEYNLDKIVELAKSGKIIEKVLFDSVEINQKRDVIANFIIDEYGLQEVWKNNGDTRLMNFYFSKVNRNNFIPAEKKAFKLLHTLVIGSEEENIDPISYVGYNDKTGILFISTSTLSEELSLAISEAMYKSISLFYIDTSTEKQRSTYARLVEKTDSIKAELSLSQYKLASLEDKSTNLFLRKANVEQDELRLQIQVLSIIYGEALKNREAASFLLENATPFFQIIDKPIGPLYLNESYGLKYAVVFSIVGVVVLSLFLIGIKELKAILSDL